MFRRILITLVVLSGCSDDDRGEDCGAFGCATPISSTTVGPLTGGSGEDGPTDASTSSGDEPYCTQDDNQCVGDDAIKFCDESGDKLHTVSCQAVCGMDQQSFGCMLDDQGDAKCFCGPPADDTTGGTTGDDGTTTTTTTGNGTTTGGDPGCDDPEYPVACKAQHGVPASCWSAGTDCTTVVECPFGFAACDPGYAVDCSDQVCVTVIDGFESTNALCSNGQDDDGDNYADCSDLLCYVNPNVTACKGESTDYECANGVDDDGDGYIDCDDIACQASPAVTVCGLQEWSHDRCTNGYDDENDGAADCEDLSCYNPFTLACWG